MVTGPPPIPPDRLAQLEERLERLHVENKKSLTKQEAQNNRILDLLQGEDPLSRPGEGLVSQVKELLEEKRQRDERGREIRRLAWTGAISGASALLLFLWEVFRRWFREHWH